MHSLLSRANAFSAFAFSTIAMLTALNIVSVSLMSTPDMDVNIKVHEVYLRNRPQFRHLRQKNDLGFFRFDLDADFSPLFNWNTKMLFLYLTAEYETTKNSINQVVVWDKILYRFKDAEQLKLETQMLKYPFFDDGEGLRGNKNVTLSLHWNVIPVAGLLTRIKAGFARIQFPENYHE